MIPLLMRILKNPGKATQNRSVQVAFLMLALFSFSATGYMFFEFRANPDLTWPDAFWWTIVTMTTVGYGDYFPTTAGGRWLVGMPTMMLGIGLLGYGLSLVATKMLESHSLEVKGLKRIMSREHVVICGWSSLERLTKLIQELRCDAATADSAIVLVTDQIEELPVELRSGDKFHFVAGDPGREPTLEQANIRDALAVIIQANLEDERADDRSLKIALAVECYHPEVYTVAECVNPENVPYFRRANCDSVVCISQLSEQMLVQELHDPGLTEVVAQLTSNQFGKQIYISSPKTEFGTYGEAGKKMFDEGVVLIGIRRGGENQLLPAPDTALEPEDRLILISDSRP